MKLKLTLVATLSIGSIFAQAPEYGPAKGTLVIQGGGSDAGTGIVETFINQAGGLGREDQSSFPPPAATGRRTEAFGSTKRSRCLPPGRSAALTNVCMLHTHDPKVADTEEFAKILRDAKRCLVRRWAAVEYCRLLCQHTDASGISQGSGARRRHRRQFGGRHDPGRLSGTRSDRRFGHCHDAGSRSTNTASPSFARLRSTSTSILATAGTTSFR